MSGTLLQIVQDAMAECGFRAPTQVAGSSSDESQTLLRLANRAGTMITDAHPWQVLQKEGSISLVTSTQAYNLPSDFLFLTSQTMWNRDAERPVTIALTPSEWQYYKGWLSVAGLSLRARIQDTQIVFEQNITAAQNGQTVYFEYRSNAWCETNGGTGLARFQSDTDVSNLNRDLVTSCLVYLIKKQRGLDWEMDYQSYVKKLRTHMSNDNGARTARLSGEQMPYLGVSVPDGNYGGV